MWPPRARSPSDKRPGTAERGRTMHSDTHPMRVVGVRARAAPGYMCRFVQTGCRQGFPNKAPTQGISTKHVPGPNTQCACRASSTRVWTSWGWGSVNHSVPIAECPVPSRVPSAKQSAQCLAECTSPRPLSAQPKAYGGCDQDGLEHVSKGHKGGVLVRRGSRSKGCRR